MKELFYLDARGNLMSVPIAPGKQFSAGPPKQVLGKPIMILPGGSLRTYDVSPDGRRFIVIKAIGESVESQIVVRQHWLGELGERRTGN
jgi:hypothetical protein